MKSWFCHLINPSTLQKTPPFTLLSHQVPITTPSVQMANTALPALLWPVWAGHSSSCHQEPQPPSCVCVHAPLAPSLCRSHSEPLPKAGDKLQNKILLAPLPIDGCSTSRTFMTQIPLRIQDTVRGEWPCYRNSAVGYENQCDSLGWGFSCFHRKRPIIPN